MARKKEEVVMATSELTGSGEPMTRSGLFNAVRSVSNIEYNTTIPIVDATSVNHYSRVIAADSSLLDEFTRVLVTKVVAMYVKSASAWDSAYKVFHKGPMPNGIGVEIMARNLIEAKQWGRDGAGDNYVGELFKDHGDDIVAQIQTIDQLVYFPITVWQGELLYNSIVTADGLSAFIEDIFTQLRNSKEVYLYERIKKTVDDFVENPESVKLTYETREVVDAESARELLVEAQSALGDFQFFSKDNNMQGVDMHSKNRTPVLITTPRVKAHIDINALAAMFNLEKENVSKYILLVDKLPNNVQAILTTDEFINLRTRIDKVTEQFHPLAGRTNYFNILQILVVNNQFENVRIFKKKDNVGPPLDGIPDTTTFTNEGKDNPEQYTYEFEGPPEFLGRTTAISGLNMDYVTNTLGGETPTVYKLPNLSTEGKPVRTMVNTSGANQPFDDSNYNVSLIKLPDTLYTVVSGFDKILRQEGVELVIPESVTTIFSNAFNFESGESLAKMKVYVDKGPSDDFDSDPAIVRGKAMSKSMYEILPLSSYVEK